ncbi:MAG: right-handed parallel beta-helix repeat-containing protein [Deltaproteobacteria bacterium]|nr:right-handed parallel beta-helix repeat-containing protein [Deltaproteobacteria bacterium]
MRSSSQPALPILCLSLAALLGCTQETESEPSGGGGGTAPTGPCAPGELALEGTCGGMCPAGQLADENGDCLPAGISTDRCAEGFEWDGEALCDPILPPEPCDPGQMAIPGDTACREVAPCGTEPWGDIPVDGTTVYVDGAYTGGSSAGSAAQPFTTITEGVGAVAAGGMVAVAAGTYNEDLILQGKAVKLWGRCPSMVEVVGTANGTATVFVRSGASGSEVHSLAVTGPNLGVVVSAAENVLVDQVWVHDAGGRGIDVERTLGPAGITVRGSLVEDASDVGIYAQGAPALIEDSQVRGVQAPSGTARGINVQIDTAGGVPAEVTLRRSVVEQIPDTGVRVWGSVLLVEGSVVRDTWSLPTSPYGYGIDVYSDAHPSGRGSATVRQSLVERSEGVGMRFNGADGIVEASVVRDIAPVADNQLAGRAVTADDREGARATLALSWSTLERCTGGLVATGADGTVAGTLIRDQISAGETGRGIQLQDNEAGDQIPIFTLTGVNIDGAQEVGLALIAGQTLVQSTRVGNVAGAGIAVQSYGTRGTATLVGTLVEDVVGVGINVLGADATFDGSAVRNVVAEGLFGRGINVQYSLVTAQRATAVLRHTLVDRANEVGVLIISSDGVVEDSLVRDTGTLESGILGDGLCANSVLGEATLSLLRTTTVGNARVGVSSFGGQVLLADNLIECNTIDLNGEDYSGHQAQFADQGGNVCRCGDAVETCKVLSSSLEPPQAAPEE